MKVNLMSFRTARTAARAAPGAPMASPVPPAPGRCREVAVLAVAAADGMGIPLSLGDPDITAASAVHNVLATIRELIRN